MKTRPQKKSKISSKKSKKSNEQEEVLRVRTPKDSKLKYLRDAGVIVPDEIPVNEDDVPLDFTTVSSRGIGHLQSRYAVRHAHAIFAAAKVGADAAMLKRELRFSKSKFRLRHKKLAVNIVTAMMEEDDEIVALETKLAEVEAEEELLSSLAQGYAGIRDAASREITRRTAERASVD